ncbi:hypothetical protein [Mangrovactinospora gilvigrisea]|uniref:hypothetical protein n=1 Tax=Mangrovactinospora gilvigrisea TaxID=1428644 RepID=UPI000A3DE18D|nr:hypothetical protein [Mangrovactinospora gilvigrisea]
MVFREVPLANGLRTDHPVPGLPFVDDSHIPLPDPEAIEAVGRHKGQGMWGRYDDIHDAGWHAFTTDPIRHDLGWSIRHHPEHGTSVWLMRDEDISTMHYHWSKALLYRAGGYWFDGARWYRPRQVWDPASDDHEHRPATAAVTVTAADLLDRAADADRACTIKIANFAADAHLDGQWNDHLALWARLRMQRKDSRPLDACAVNLATPELAADQMLGMPQFAERAHLAASTLRGYLARNQGDLPMPQAEIGSRAVWARAVVEDWIEARHRSTDSVMAAMGAGDPHQLPPGAAALRDRLAQSFTRQLWDRQEVRKRWALRHRTEPAVTEVAEQLAWSVASDLKHIVPTEPLSATMRHAVLDAFSTYSTLRKSAAVRAHLEGEESDADDWPILALGIPIAQMLDWMIRHYPDTAQATIGEIQFEANRRWGLPAAHTARAIRRSLELDSKLDEDILRDFLDRVLPRTR